MFAPQGAIDRTNVMDRLNVKYKEKYYYFIKNNLETRNHCLKYGIPEIQIIKHYPSIFLLNFRFLSGNKITKLNNNTFERVPNLHGL